MSCNYCLNNTWGKCWHHWTNYKNEIDFWTLDEVCQNALLWHNQAKVMELLVTDDLLTVSQNIRFDFASRTGIMLNIDGTVNTYGWEYVEENDVVEVRRELENERDLDWENDDVALSRAVHNLLGHHAFVERYNEEMMYSKQRVRKLVRDWKNRKG